MRAMMDKLFARYGIPARVQTRQGSFRGKVFFHSVNSRSWQNMERCFFPLGEIPRGQYICVFPISLRVQAGDTVWVGSGVYQVRRVEEMLTHQGPMYRWGLCVEKGGDDTWGAVG